MFQVLARIRKYLQLLGRKIDKIVKDHELYYKQESKYLLYFSFLFLMLCSTSNFFILEILKKQLGEQKYYINYNIELQRMVE